MNEQLYNSNNVRLSFFPNLIYFVVFFHIPKFLVVLCFNCFYRGYVKISVTLMINLVTDLTPVPGSLTQLYVKSMELLT